MYQQQRVRGEQCSREKVENSSSSPCVARYECQWRSIASAAQASLEVCWNRVRTRWTVLRKPEMDISQQGPRLIHASAHTHTARKDANLSLRLSHTRTDWARPCRPSAL